MFQGCYRAHFQYFPGTFPVHSQYFPIHFLILSWYFLNTFLVQWYHTLPELTKPLCHPYSNPQLYITITPKPMIKLLLTRKILCSVLLQGTCSFSWRQNYKFLPTVLQFLNTNEAVHSSKVSEPCDRGFLITSITIGV